MYAKKNISVSKFGLENYIEGNDVYNSKLQILLSADPSIARVPYRIEQFAFRPDLICEDFYGSMDFYGLFLLTCGAKISDFWLGNVLYLIPKGTLSMFVSSI